MITYKPAGRLGNALFQASAMIAYSIENNIDFSMPSHTNDAKWNPVYFPYLINHKFNGALESVTVKEPDYFKFDILPFDAQWENKNIVLDGYFQNPKYFQEHRKAILELLNLPWVPIKDTVSIQIRRGDYLIYTDKHPAFSDEYMCNAMAYFATKGFTKFRVFSDDIPWCRSYFGDKKFSKFTIYFSEGETELKDLIGISECAHHINSSSTFSWWGAWLNRSEDKIVVTPRVWLLHKHANQWTDEIIPSEWIKM